jgi:hypothetical protein
VTDCSLFNRPGTQAYVAIESTTPLVSRLRAAQEVTTAVHADGPRVESAPRPALPDLCLSCGRGRK